MTNNNQYKSVFLSDIHLGFNGCQNKKLENFLTNRIEELHKQKIKLKIIGVKNFSKKLNKLLNISEKKTSKNTKLQINLALNYGSKFELINAFKKIQINKEKIRKIVKLGV